MEERKKGWLGRLFRRDQERPNPDEEKPTTGERLAEPSPDEPVNETAQPVDLADHEIERQGSAEQAVEDDLVLDAPQAELAPEPAATPEPATMIERETVDVTDEPASPLVQLDEPVERGGWLSRLRQGLSRSSNALSGNIAGIFTRRKLDDETLEELEDALIMADLGVEAAARMVQKIAHDRFGKEVTDLEIREALAKEMAEVLEQVAEPLPMRAEARPQVVLIAGVNGVGKTTTIGKLAKQQMLQGRRVMMAACDTFRAAAVEQLEIWGNRNGCPVMKAKTGADAAGLAYDALARAAREGYDLLLIDTAGRLQNKAELMEELAKIVRVIQKLEPEAPHDVILVLDATTGQNVFNQVDLFNAMVELTGFVVTKLDGSAKGGVVVALAERFGLPVHAVGVGEAIDDLRPFDPDTFARGLLGLDQGQRDAA